MALLTNTVRVIPGKHFPAGPAPPLLEPARLEDLHDPSRADPLLFHDQLQRALQRLEFPRQIKIQIQNPVLLLQRIDRIRARRLLDRDGVDLVIDTVFFPANFFQEDPVPDV